MCIKLCKPERHPPSLAAIKTQQNMVAVHLSSMINSAADAEHLSVVWKMPLEDAEPATNLLSLQCTTVKVFVLFCSSCYSSTPTVSPPVETWPWVWNCGKGADLLSEQLAILLTVFPELSSQFSH